MKTAFITGANRGIGYEIARQLGTRGWNVMLAVRDESKGNDTMHKLKTEGINHVSVVQVDVSNIESIQHAARILQQQNTVIDVLINNAAIMIDKTDITRMDLNVFTETMQTNVVGVIALTQALVPMMPKGGRIINLSSGLGALSSMGSGHPAYSISKTTINALTRQFAGALSGKGIAVNCMCPGWVQTDMGGAGAPRAVSKGAETAVWLAAEADQHLTGKFWRDKHEIDW